MKTMVVGIITILILAGMAMSQDSTYLNACGTLSTSFLDCPRVILFSEPMPMVTEIVAVNPSGFQHGDTVRFDGWFFPYQMDALCMSANPAATHTLTTCDCCVGMTGDVNCDGGNDVEDLTRLLDYMFGSREPLCCFEQGDIVGDGRIDVDDLNEMIQVLFIVFRPMPPCGDQWANSADTGASWEITLDGTTGIYPPCSGQDTTSQIAIGSTARFFIKYRNLSTETYQITNAFRVYSPDGANRSQLSSPGNVVFPGGPGYIGVDTTGLLDRSRFLIHWEMECFGCDGFGADTVALSGISGEPEQGLPAGFDDRVFSAFIQLPYDLNLIGKHICLDTAALYPTSNTWRWAQLSNGGSLAAAPRWGGPYCFAIGEPSINSRPPISGCVSMISANHCQQFTYDFDAIDPEGDPIWFGLVSGPGSIDSVTGIWTANLPGPGDYTLIVQARDFCGGGPECTMTIRGLDSTQVSCKASTPTVVVPLGSSASQLPVVFNDCDPLTFTLDSSGGAVGTISLVDSTGELTYTPAEADLALNSPIRMRVIVSDGTSTDVWVPTWVIQRVCVGTVGNVDCDPAESVDVGDLTTLIDNLFITFIPLCSPGEANCDGGGGIDVADVTALIDNLFITFTLLPACP